MKDEKRKLLALTFDDGPNDTTMVEILHLLKQYGAAATFFVEGNKITDRSIPALKQAVAQGCEIGNHSRSHLHMSSLPETEIAEEVAFVQLAVEKATGERPVLFRPPYIDVSEQMCRTIDMPFISGAGNYDWDAECSVARRISLAMESVCDGAILLMHCFEGNDATVEALKTILPAIAEDYRMVTVSELFSLKEIPLEKGHMYECAK